MPNIQKLCAVCCVLSTAVHADDSGLYGQPVPSDAAFIRWIDVGSEGQRVAFGRDFSQDAIPGQTFAAISTALLDGAEAGAFYSIVASVDGSVTAIKEPGRDEASKVHLILLNAGDAPVSLVVSDAEVEIIGATSASMAKSRAVNPVSAALTVRSDATGAVLEQFDVALRRGQNLTFAVVGDEVMAIPSAFGPVIAQEDG